jgi:hypothetical protein
MTILLTAATACFLAVFIVFGISAPAASAQQTKVLFREDFATLDNWKDFFFPGIKRHSVYTIEGHNEGHYLKAASNASASAIVYKESFSVYDYPRVRWRWKVQNIYVKGDPRTKAGDDYPIRIYIMFEYDPDMAGPLERLQFGLARKRYGEYPPHSSLSYVWANREEDSLMITSPYTERAKMILQEMNRNKVGGWHDAQVDLLEDYRKAFGTDPPKRARLAVMNDSDNTGESSISWLDFIEVFQ